jgi:ribosome modulation factor
MLPHITVRVGQVFRTWRRRRAVAKQDEFIEAMAWTEGCNRRWRGDPRDIVPYVQDEQRAAWLAGWQWADAHPSRRRQSGQPGKGSRRGADHRARLARGARRCVAGLTLLAVARWWWRRRGIARPGGVSASVKNAETDSDRDYT